MRRFIRVLTLALIALVIFLAPSVGAQKQTLRVMLADWMNPTGQVTPQTALWNEAVARFQKMHPDTQLSYEAVPWEQLWIKFSIAYEAGTPPDVICIPDMVIIANAKAGRLLPLDKYVSQYDVEDWSKLLGEATMFNGKRYAIMTNTDIRTLYFRKDHFTNAGLDPNKRPETWYWEDFVDITKKLNHKFGADQWAFMVIGGKTLHTPLMWSPLVWAQGGEVVNSDGKAVYDSNEGYKAAAFYQDLIYKYGVMPRTIVSMQEVDVHRAFMAGKASIIITGNWAGGVFDKEMTDPSVVGWGYVPYPKNGKPSTLSGIWEWSISSKCKAPDVAWDFVSAMTGKLWVIGDAEIQPRVPVRKSLVDHPAYSKNSVVRAQAEYGVKFGHPEPTTAYPLEWCDILNVALQKIWGENAPAKQTLDAAAKSFNDKYFK
jgi:multiple sugar transport system substrate-binding protein